jgi:hypothetical protein
MRSRELGAVMKRSGYGRAATEQAFAQREIYP